MYTDTFISVPDGLEKQMGPAHAKAICDSRINEKKQEKF
jgi:hypothetical protein